MTPLSLQLSLNTAEIILLIDQKQAQYYHDGLMANPNCLYLHDSICINYLLRAAMIRYTLFYRIYSYGVRSHSYSCLLA